MAIEEPGHDRDGHDPEARASQSVRRMNAGWVDERGNGVREGEHRGDEHGHRQHGLTARREETERRREERERRDGERAQMRRGAPGRDRGGAEERDHAERCLRERDRGRDVDPGRERETDPRRCARRPLEAREEQHDGEAAERGRKRRVRARLGERAAAQTGGGDPRGGESEADAHRDAKARFGAALDRRHAHSVRRLYRAPIDSLGVSSEAARRPRLVWAAGVVVMVLAGLAGLGIFLAKQPFGFDLWAYVLAARHLLAGEPLYSVVPQMPAGPFGEYHYAPIVAVPFALLAPLPFWLATALWIGVNTGVAAAIGLHLIRPLPRDARPWAAAAFVLFLPTILEISLGNINLITLALCLVAWSQRQRAAVGGALLAVAIGAKLLPLSLILFYLAAAARPRRRLDRRRPRGGAVAHDRRVLARDAGIRRAVRRASGQQLRPRSSSRTHGRRSSPRSSVRSIGAWVLPTATLATALVGGLAARRRPHDETHLHHLALAFAPYLSLFGLLWFPYLVFALPLLASSLHRALLFPHPQLRVVLVAALAVSWLLLQIVGET